MDTKVQKKVFYNKIIVTSYSLVDARGASMSSARIIRAIQIRTGAMNEPIGQASCIPEVTFSSDRLARRADRSEPFGPV
jgi:hypothetical protein